MINCSSVIKIDICITWHIVEVLELNGTKVFINYVFLNIVNPTCWLKRPTSNVDTETQTKHTSKTKMHSTVTPV